ncbi:MAG: trehalose-phosphatase [Bryobacteraceae bacterium]
MTLAQQVRPSIPLLENLALVQQRVASAERLALFLDFDGTVSPIVLNPKDAALDPDIRSTLETLNARADFIISIVSGRALADVRDRAALDNVIYVGNHGLEIECRSIRFREPRAEALRRELRSLLLQLRLALCDTDGLEIEDKGLTLSVHFRRVTEHLHDWVRNVALSTVKRSKSFGCRDGRMVVEVRPQVNWHKGNAVKWIAREILPPQSLPIYIGDDVTDEDAFTAIPEGITIRVGEHAETHAEYLLSDVHEVGQFLRWLDHAKPHASFANTQRAGR